MALRISFCNNFPAFYHVCQFIPTTPGFDSKGPVYRVLFQAFIIFVVVQNIFDKRFLVLAVYKMHVKLWQTSLSTVKNLYILWLIVNVFCIFLPFPLRSCPLEYNET